MRLSSVRASERFRGLRPTYDLCVLDDLFFSIKIKTAPKRWAPMCISSGLPDQVLESIRSKAPRLVIFDLDSGRCGRWT
jgi:hypothetical protein